MITSLKNFLKQTRAATAVEFAMVAVLFLMFLFGIVETARLFWTMNTLEYAIQDTARFALVNDNATPAELEQYAAASMAGIQIDPNNLTVTVTNTTVSGVNFIQVDGVYLFSTLVPLLPASWDAFNLEATARLPVP